MERATCEIVHRAERASGGAHVSWGLATGSRGAEEGVGGDEEARHSVGRDGPFVDEERRASLDLRASFDGLQPLVPAGSSRYLESDSLQPHCLKGCIFMSHFYL